jgi:Tfp pilus assembly protein PilF
MVGKGRTAAQGRTGSRPRLPCGACGKAADVAVAHYDLAQAYLLSGQNAEAKQETLAALEVAPSFEPAQDLLLKIVGGG